MFGGSGGFGFNVSFADRAFMSVESVFETRVNRLVYPKYSCSSAISTLEGIENKQRLQTLSIDNVCNRCLFSIPSIVYPMYCKWP